MKSSTGTSVLNSADTTVMKEKISSVTPSIREVKPCLQAVNLRAFYGKKEVLHDVTVNFPDRHVTAIIGPSGCGKSTLLRCLNRLHETVQGGRVSGDVTFYGRSIYSADSNPIDIRRQIGMVFQRPTPFPTMSIRDNVAAGLRVLDERKSAKETEEIVQQALQRSGLWDEVKDRLKDSAMDLSGGQQQRLCIARAIATHPQVLLMDEPTASLDPMSTQKIESLISELREHMTIVIVTHNMQQAARVSDQTVFMLNGDLVESLPTPLLFASPSDPRTEAYVNGRFG